MMGGGELHQELKNLCLNADWKYAVFWKLKHQDQMVLTLEDAYCDNNAQDLIGLEVSKMSHCVYPIGEGIVGQVAATGNHLWISGHQLVNFQHWKPQFKAGIRTITLVSVFPHGAVQLGSLDIIPENPKLVNHIREVFFNLMMSRDCSPCVTDLSTSSVRLNRYANNLDRSMEKNRSNTWKTIKTIHNHEESKNPEFDFVQSALSDDQNQNLFSLGFSNGPTLNNPAANLAFITESNESFNFPGGCELYEAFGPVFRKQKSSFDWETATPETLAVDPYMLNQRSASDHLLEAVVGSVCCSGIVDNEPALFGQLVKPLSVSNFREPAEVGKKRARPGESGRPRPRDRQMIQDRLKELRQLVPDGSKCSIDLLLERTIKHMRFMECVTKHADKIDKCAKFKGSSDHEQGSSWAMEVGSYPKVCPIIVENMGVDGQMLVEMMSDDCVQFLEMTDAIKSLGLAILKGATETHGDKFWMCFVVEGENGRSVQRMDILLSLVQMLQSKTKP